MLLRLPDSGSWVAAALSSIGDPLPPSVHAGIADVTEAQLGAALDALARGDIEFVILEDGDAFLQAAGDGDGPYQLERQTGGGSDLVAVDGGVDRATLRREMFAYLRRGRS